MVGWLHENACLLRLTELHLQACFYETARCFSRVFNELVLSGVRRRFFCYSCGCDEKPVAVTVHVPNRVAFDFAIKKALCETNGTTNPRAFDHECTVSRANSFEASHSSAIAEPNHGGHGDGRNIAQDYRGRRAQRCTGAQVILKPQNGIHIQVIGLQNKQ